MRSQELLEQAIPGYLNDINRVLAAWYFLAGKLDVDTAAQIAGQSQDDFLAFVKVKKTKDHWTVKAKILTQEQIDRGPGFRQWILGHGTKATYIYSMIKAWRLFGGTPVEQLPLPRVLQLFKFPADKINSLVTTGTVTLDGVTYTVDELAAMSAKRFRSLTYSYRSSRMRSPSSWAEMALKLRDGGNGQLNKANYQKLEIRKQSAYVILKVDEVFAGTPVQQLPLRRAYALLSLDPDKIDALKKTGDFSLQGKNYTVTDLAAISFAELKKICKKKENLNGAER